jgi:hypothetical protein
MDLMLTLLLVPVLGALAYFISLYAERDGYKQGKLFMILLIVFLLLLGLAWARSRRSS